MNIQLPEPNPFYREAAATVVQLLQDGKVLYRSNGQSMANRITQWGLALQDSGHNPETISEALRKMLTSKSADDREPGPADFVTLCNSVTPAGMLSQSQKAMRLARRHALWADNWNRLREDDYKFGTTETGPAHDLSADERLQVEKCLALIGRTDLVGLRHAGWLGTTYRDYDLYREVTGQEPPDDLPPLRRQSAEKDEQ